MTQRDAIAAFIAHLEHLRAGSDSHSKHAMAVLKRSLRLGPDRVPAVHRFVLPALPADARHWLIDTAYLIAGLFASHPLSSRAGNLGDHLARLNALTSSAGLTRRFDILLTAQPDDLPRLLIPLLDLLRQAGIAVNWGQLFADLLAYSFPDGQLRVRREWATAFYTPRRAVAADLAPADPPLLVAEPALPSPEDE